MAPQKVVFLVASVIAFGALVIAIAVMSLNGLHRLDRQAERRARGVQLVQDLRAASIATTPVPKAKEHRPEPSPH